MATPNALFALVNVSNPEPLETKLKSALSWIHLKLTDSEWLIYAPNSTTAKEISDYLDLSGSGADLGIVVRVESYFGRNYQHVWDWVRTKQGAELDNPATTVKA